jgi:iron complex transport system permease protein
VTGREQYRALAFRRIVILVLLTVALCFSIALDMALGPANYSLSEVLSALADPAGVAAQLRVIIWDIRMPIA